MNDSLTFTMRLDASDLRKMLPPGGARGGGAGGGGMPGGGGGGGGGWMGRFFGGGGNEDQQLKKQARANASDPTFKSIFKPLAALTIMNKALGGILRNSQIANTYGAAMGKLFGAAIDLLMVPFLPFFNLLLVGLTKLISWLITSGALEEISKWVTRAVGYLEGIAHWIVEVWHAITHLDFGKLASLIATGVWNAIKTVVKDPAGALTAAALIPIGGAIGLGILNKLTFGLAGKGLGGLLKLGTKGVKGLFGMGGGGAAAEAGAAEAAGGGAAAAGGGGAAAAGGVGMASILGTGALAIGAGLGAGALMNYGLGKAGVHGTARQALTGAAGGAAAGAIIGSVVPGLGTAVGAVGGGLIGGGIGLAKGMGLFGGGGGGGQPQGSGNVTNSNNTINFTQNNTYGSNVNEKKIADDAIKEIERRTGFKLANRGGH